MEPNEYEDYKKEIKAKDDYDYGQEVNEADENFFNDLDFDGEGWDERAAE